MGEHACSRPSWPGSIAASSADDWTTGGTPLLPAVLAGLHCGDEIGRRDDITVNLLPAVLAGLHCGPRRTYWSR